MNNTETKQNIEIKVDSMYEAEFSKPDIPSFIFSYKITIVNHNPFPVKLLNREWFITDSNGEIVTVQGEGVVGLTPTIQANGSFQYTSNVNLKSGIGRMKGKYQMINLKDNSVFKSIINEFHLEADFVLN